MSLSPVEGKSVPFPGLLNVGHGSVSPDGHWMVYSIDRTVRREMFVQSLPKEADGPDAVGRFQISSAGGELPVLRAGGKEIYYLASNGQMMAVSVESGVNLFRPGAPRPLFQTGLNAAVLNIGTRVRCHPRRPGVSSSTSLRWRPATRPLP